MHIPERPTATVQEVCDVADAIQPRYRALVLMTGFLGLRWGELIGLHRRDLGLDHGAVRVRRSVAELDNGQRGVKAPKSAVGKRTVGPSGFKWRAGMSLACGGLAKTAPVVHRRARCPSRP
ncbi:hypothetical protein GCM10027162_62160 [Streptomyces incanus]